MRYRRLMISWGIVFLMFFSQNAIAANFLGAGPGNGADSNPATFHFDNQNQDFQMTQPDGTPLADTEAQLTYGTAWKIIYDNQDYVNSQGLSVQGTPLNGSDWTSQTFPPVGRLAVDPATGRFKFAQTWEGTTNPLAPDLGEPSRYADIALNDSGYGFCAYYYQYLYKSYVQAHSPSTGWQSAVYVGSPTADRNSGIKIDMNSNGEAICIFQEVFGYKVHISANRYIPGLGWYGAVTIDADTTDTPQANDLAMNDEGKAFCSYYQKITPSAGFYDRIWAAEYTHASGWYQPVTIDAGNYRAFESTMDMNNSGTAFCVFRQHDGSGYERMWGNQYIPGAGWQTADILDHGTTNGAGAGRVAVGEDNTAICVFQEDDGITERISANVYVPGSGWQGAQRIDAGEGIDARSPAIVVNRYGVGICVFRTMTGSDYRIYANHYSPGSGWQGAVPIDGGISLIAASPQIDINDAGEAFCVFQKYDGSNTRVYANKYLPGSGWTGPLVIDANTGDQTARPVVAMNNRGLALAVFEQRIDSVYRLFANRYLSNIPAGPFQVNYSSAEPTPTPDAPTRTSVQITNRRLEPIRGQQAVIQYALAESGMVSIIIYDLQGVLVKTLVKDYQNRGTHTLNWNASNAENALVASGVYVVRFILPGLRKTEKIVVIK